jgi:hypothetical protein
MPGIGSVQMPFRRVGCGAGPFQLPSAGDAGTIRTERITTLAHVDRPWGVIDSLKSGKARAFRKDLSNIVGAKEAGSKLRISNVRRDLLNYAGCAGKGLTRRHRMFPAL